MDCTSIPLTGFFCFFRLSEIQEQHQQLYIDIWTGHVYVLCATNVETEANARFLQALTADTFFEQASIRPCHMRSCFALPPRFAPLIR